MSYLGRSAKLSLKAQEKVSFLATAGQTVKTGLSYTPSFVEVYVNGVLLTDTTDFTATNGNSITFTVALLLNDEVTVISLKTFTVADHYSKTEADTLLATKLPLAGGTMTGALFIASPNQATGGNALQIRQGNNTAYGIDMGLSQTDGHLNISRVNNGTSTHMMTLARDTGNVGIGTASPAKPLDVTGDIRTSTGILFGTDTAAANTLSDYETGTFTPGGTGIDTSNSVAYYTKVGNICIAQMWIYANGSTDGTITGLPFTAGHTNNAIAAGTIGYINGSVTGLVSAGQNTSITMYNGTGTGTMASGNQMHCAMTYRTT